MGKSELPSDETMSRIFEIDINKNETNLDGAVIGSFYFENKSLSQIDAHIRFHKYGNGLSYEYLEMNDVMPSDVREILNLIEFLIINKSI